MEESNQFLEENAITYDTEADEKVIPEDVVYVYSGNAMNMEEVFQFSCLKTVEPVIVAGEQGSGKTTLEVMMYRLVDVCGKHYNEGIPGTFRGTYEKDRICRTDGSKNVTGRKKVFASCIV